MQVNGREFRRYAAAVGILAGCTLLAEVIYRLTGTTRLSMVFLAAVVTVSYLLGSGPAYLTAILAVVLFNFYLVDPRFTFTLLSPEEVLNLIVFLSVAMLTGNLTGRVRDQAARLLARGQATSALLAATREFSISDREETIRERLAEHLSAAAQGEALLVHGLRMQTSPGRMNVPPDLLLAAKEVARTHPDQPLATERKGGWFLRQLQASEAVVGAAAWRSCRDIPLSGDEQALLDILVDSGATAIARVRLAEGKTRAEAVAQTERTRNALLSSISHDMRTPLASILVAATSLRRYGRTFDADVREDLASTIQEEAERLDSFVANLLSMTRLEAGAVIVRPVPFSLPEAIGRVTERRASQRRLNTALEPDLREASGDPLLFEQALANVLENAMRYSATELPIHIGARNEPGRLHVTVTDRGPGVPDADLERIFEKFYRSGETANFPGTGLGLSIARGLLEAMGGRISARNAAPHGLSVEMTLPAAA